jgi:hypothetical protein
VVLAAKTALGRNSLIHIEFRRTARRWAREHTPHLPVMYAPPVGSPARNVVPTYRRARASRDTGVVAREGRADFAVITLGRVRIWPIAIPA